MQDQSTLVGMLTSLRQIALANGDAMLTYLIEMAIVHVLEQEEAKRRDRD